MQDATKGVTQLSCVLDMGRLGYYLSMGFGMNKPGLDQNRNHMKDKTAVIVFLIFSAIIVLCLCIILSKREMRISVIDINDYQIQETTSDVEWFVEKAEFDTIGNRDYVSIRGWCTLRDREPKTIKLYIFLKNTDTGVFYKLPTAVELRSDVTEYINDSYDHDFSGFMLDSQINHLDFEENTYELFIYYSNNHDNYLVDTNQTLAKAVRTVFEP